MIKLRNKHSVGLSLYRPAEDSGALHADADQVVEVPGELVTDWSEYPELADQPDDCLITRTPDGDLRAWPLALWEHAETPKPTEPAAQRDVDNHGSDLAVALTEAQMGTAPAVVDPMGAPGQPSPSTSTSTEHPPAELFTPASAASTPAATPANEG